MIQREWEDLLQHGIHLMNRRLYHAALECWERASQIPCDLSDERGKLYNHIGKVYHALGYRTKALHNFTAAVSCTSDPETLAMYRTNQAICYRHTDSDMAQRLLFEILDELGSLLSPLSLIPLYANLGSTLCFNEFHIDGLSYLRRSLELCESGDFPYRTALYNNLGVVYLDLGDYETAESYLLKALTDDEAESLPTIMELSRLYMDKGDLYRCLEYAQKALPLIWFSIINFERDEIGYFFRLLANISRYAGEAEIAIRLIEKALMLFGQAQMWKAWQQAQQILEDWMSSPKPKHSDIALQFSGIHNFVRLFDALNAQEIINSNFSNLLDTRVIYADVLAQSFGMTDEERKSLIYACRFADYGLTALELEVLNNPNRSDSAWKQYQQHPLLGVQMLESLHLDVSVTLIISNHHERFDGTGFPHAKSGDQIPLAAKIFAVADTYANGVTKEECPHSVVMSGILEQTGKAFDPEVVKRFEEIFQSPA